MIGVACQSLIMGGNHHGRTLAMNTSEELHDVPGHLGIQITCRFISENEPGRIDQRACNGNALLLAP
jgi:hypothetical protein